LVTEIDESILETMSAKGPQQDAERCQAGSPNNRTATTHDMTP
jgi:hypothetical protein